MGLSDDHKPKFWHFWRNEHWPSSAAGLRQYICLSLPIIIFILAIIARTIPGPRIIDDAYITYRYARNILAGNGFVYNPTERVLGTTTPFYTILLAIIGLFTGKSSAPFPIISLVLNACADGISCLILIDLGKRLGSRIAGYGVAFVWAITPFSVTFAIGGLETSVFILLLCLMTEAYLQKKYSLFGLFGALALLTRPDALIIICPLFLERILTGITLFPDVFYRLRRGRWPIKNIQISFTLKEILYFSIPLIAWVIFAFYYFGNPIPHSIAAKSLAYRLPPNAALIRLLQHYATPFMDDVTFGTVGIAIGLLLYPFLSFVGILAGWKVNSHSWPFLLYPWLYFFTFSYANPLIFRWYLTPPLPAYILAILLGGVKILEGFGSLLHKLSTKIQTRMLIASQIILVIMVPFTMSLHDWTFHPDHGQDRPAPQMAYIQLELLYRKAADLLLPEITHLSHPPLLAAGDVGVLGYFTNANILDTVGLNSLVSTHYYPLENHYYTINYAIPPDLILDLKPDYIVMLEVYGREGLLKDNRFKLAYSLKTIIPTDMYGSRGMMIFTRNP